MSQKGLFERLGAPLNNTRWSWGAVRPTDGTVFLRVWQDEYIRKGKKTFMRLTSNEHFQQNAPGDLGYQERSRHVSLIKSGAPCFMIICVAVDAAAIPRQVASFNEDDVMRGGELMESNGDCWLEITERVRVSEA